MNIAISENIQLKRFALFICCIPLIAFRELDLLIYPRFWAEEGQLFYQFALHHSIKEIFILPQVGYITLFNSIVSAIQAKFVSVESAPIVSTYLGFIVQLIPVGIIVFTDHQFWNSMLKKIVCAMIVIILTPPELWLNTTNSHFIFGLITFLIMVMPAINLSKSKKFLFRFLLLLGGLTGPASTFLTPVFLFQAYREKSREKYIQAAIITCCSVIQAIVIIHTLIYNNHYQRLEQFSFQSTALAFFNDNFALSMNRPYVGFAMAIFYVYLFFVNRKSVEHLVFLVAFIIVAVPSTLGSLQMIGAPRYSYLPTCILLILISSEVFAKTIRFNTRFISSTLILFGSLTLNCAWYKYKMQYVYTPDLPKWKNEVATYRMDKNYKPKIHPDSFVKF